MFRAVPLSIIRNLSLYTTALEQQDQDGTGSVLILLPQSCSVQCKIPDDGQRNCPKHVEFCSKNKFEELVHLVGFITKIYRDSRSPERQILTHSSSCELNLTVL